MRVLVTGGAGFIGSHTVDRLVEEGMDVVVLDNLDPQVHQTTRGAPSNLKDHIRTRRIHYVKGDVRDRRSVARVLSDVDAVIHLAAAVGVGQSMYRPHYYADINVNGTAVLLDVLASRRSRVRKFVVASSMSVYGEGAYRCPHCGEVAPPTRSPAALRRRQWELPCPSCENLLAPVPTPETRPSQPASIYAISKKTQEEMVLCFGRSHGTPAVAFRYFNTYGPRQALGNPYTGVLAIFLSQLARGHRPIVFEDGLQSRDFIHVTDLANANFLALKSSRADYQALNVGTGVPTTILDIVGCLRRQLRVEIEPRILSKFRAGDIRHCYADSGRIRQLLGWRPKVELDEGIRDLVRWCGEARSKGFSDAWLRELERKRLLL